MIYCSLWWWKSRFLIHLPTSHSISEPLGYTRKASFRHVISVRKIKAKFLFVLCAIHAIFSTFLTLMFVCIYLFLHDLWTTTWRYFLDIAAKNELLYHCPDLAAHRQSILLEICINTMFMQAGYISQYVNK